MLVAQIQKIVKHMLSDDKQLERHIYDAYYLRTIRNDIDIADKVILKYLWIIENSRIWSGFLLTLTIFYQILTYFENPIPNQTFMKHQMLLYLMVHINISYNQFCSNFNFALKKMMMDFNSIQKEWQRWCFYLICVTDFINWKIEENQIRFSRLIKPALMILYSKDLR